MSPRLNLLLNELILSFLSPHGFSMGCHILVLALPVEYSDLLELDSELAATVGL